MKDKRIFVDIHDLYNLLISQCRYAYTRNNHLEPDSSYNKVKKYLNKLLKSDAEFTLHIACQLCEECISLQLNDNFFEGLDDEYYNRHQTIEFIEWLLKFIHTKGKKVEERFVNYLPYNYDSYKENIEREKSLKYRLYEVEKFERDSKVLREITTDAVTKEEADKILFNQELQTEEALIRKINLRTEGSYPERVIGELLEVITPESHKDKCYSIVLEK